MNKYGFIFFCAIFWNINAQLPHGFSWSDGGKTVVNGNFKTQVRTAGKHLCFETNTFIVRDKTGALKTIPALPEYWNPHPFIPNVYLVKSGASDVKSLKQEKELIEKKWNVEVFYNQVFTLDATTNDPNFNRQWGIENLGGPLNYNGTIGADMEVVPAWNYAKGLGVKVAILDSGVDTLHPDLMPNLLPGFDAYADSLSDTHGYPTPNFSSDGHGTACAGIVGAVQDNAIGTTGIAPQARLIPVRIFYYMQYAGNIGVQPFTSTFGLLNGAAYAWRIADCDIMSTSAGLSALFIQALQIDTQLINDEIDSAFIQGRNGLGVSMFFSAGNDDINDVLWPANLSTTMAVGASDMCDHRKSPTDCSGENWGSTFGDHLDFMAPGVKIATTDMLGANGFTTNALTLTFNGTSAACPNAAGVGALLLSANPNLTNEQVRQILSWTAEKVTYGYDSLAVLGSWDMEAGYGRLNAHQAIVMALNTNELTVENEIPLMAIGTNPSNVLEVKNISGAIQEVQWVDALGRTTSVILQPDEELRKEVAKGIYWLTCKRQHVKVMIY